MPVLQLYCKCIILHGEVHGRRLVTSYRQYETTRVHKKLALCRKASPQDIVDVAQAADVILQNGPHAWTAVAPPDGSTSPQGTHQEIQCTLSGLDSVMCIVEDVPDDNGTSAASTLVQPVADSPLNNSILEKVLETSVLISPFFFWGTSMVAMKVGPFVRAARDFA